MALQKGSLFTPLLSSNQDSMDLGRLVIREKSHHHFYKIPLGKSMSSIFIFFGMEGRQACQAAFIPAFLGADPTFLS